jgi:hypothetical protein
MLSSSKCAIPVIFSEQNFSCISYLSHLSYMHPHLVLITLIINGEESNYEAPHFAVFSTSCHLLPLKSKYSHTPSMCSLSFL